MGVALELSDRGGSWRTIQALLALLALILAGCEGDAAAPEPLCGQALGERCAGVTRTEICSETFCAEGVSCPRTLYVDATASPKGDGSTSRPFATIAAAGAAASRGDCIAVAAGSYGPATLKGGVSLLGRGTLHVTVKGTASAGAALVITSGKGGMVRGVTLTGEGRGLKARDVPGLRLRELRITKVRGVGLDVRRSTGVSATNIHINGVRSGAGGQGVGIVLADGSRATVSTSLVEGCAAQGLMISESGVKLDTSAVLKSGSYGAAIDCSLDPACQAGLASEILNSLLDDNRAVGLWVKGAGITARGSEISGTRGASGVGRGVEIQGQAALKLEKNSIHDNAYQGIVIDGSHGTLSNNVVKDNDERGIWLQKISQGTLTLGGNQVIGNKMAGVGATACVGVTIKGGKVSTTREQSVAGPSGGVDQVSDGVQLLAASTVVVDGVQIEGNKRAGMLIDGAGATVTNLTISGSKTAIVTQNVTLTKLSFSNNKNTGGAAVQPKVPASALVVRANPIGLVGSNPVPIP